MDVNPLTIHEKRLVNKYLSSGPRRLSVYAFENIYIWKGLYEIYWAVCRDSLCIFFKDAFGYFMYLPPLSGTIDPEVLLEAFDMMHTHNRNPQVCRIENVQQEAVAAYQRLGYSCAQKSSDYLCKRSELARLSGNRFKSKRSLINYFNRHYHGEYGPFSLRHRQGCLELYDQWMQERSAVHQEHVYRGMLKDSLVCLQVMFDEYRHLNMTGRVVMIDGQIKAFTFGFELSDDTFCILYEVADLSVKGLSQFIFRQFCAELRAYTYINVMDDSGLENLKQVKHSYHPVELIPAFIAQRNHGQ